MTRQIRKNVFETNSSSSHSLTLSPGDVVAQPFAKEVLRKGSITLHKGEFGWEWHRYYGVEGKLKYLFTQLFSDDITDFATAEEATAALRASEPRFDQLCRVVEDHTGVTVLAAPVSSGYIDHDSVGVGTELFNIDETLKNFLFSEKSCIETGNDNNGPSKLISTDRGEEHFYKEFYRDPLKSWTTLLITQPHRWRRSMYTPAGAEIAYDVNAELYQELLAKGCVTAVRFDVKSSWSPFEHEEKAGFTMAQLANEKVFFSEHLDVSLTYAKCKFDDPTERRVVTQVWRLPKALAAKLNALPGGPIPKESN